MSVVADDTTYGRLYDHLAAIRARTAWTSSAGETCAACTRCSATAATSSSSATAPIGPATCRSSSCGAPTTFPAGPATLSARTGRRDPAGRCRATDDDRLEAWGLPSIGLHEHRAGRDLPRHAGLADALGRSSPPIRGSGTCSGRSGRRPMPIARRRARPLAAARRGEDWTKIRRVMPARWAWSWAIASLPRSRRAWPMAWPTSAGEAWYRPRRPDDGWWPPIWRACARRPAARPRPALRAPGAGRVPHHARYYLEVIARPPLPDSTGSTSSSTCAAGPSSTRPCAAGRACWSAGTSATSSRSACSSQRAAGAGRPIEEIEPAALFEYLAARRGGERGGELVAAAPGRRAADPQAARRRAWWHHRRPRPGRRRLPVTMFGHPAAMPIGPATLAVVTGRRVVVGRCLRDRARTASAPRASWSRCPHTATVGPTSPALVERIARRFERDIGGGAGAVVGRLPAVLGRPRRAPVVTGRHRDARRRRAAARPTCTSTPCTPTGPPGGRPAGPRRARDRSRPGRHHRPRADRRRPPRARACTPRATTVRARRRRGDHHPPRPRPGPVPRRADPALRPVAETLERIHDQGGLAVAAAPDGAADAVARQRQPAPAPGTTRSHATLDAVELLNPSRGPVAPRRARRLNAEMLHLPGRQLRCPRARGGRRGLDLVPRRDGRGVPRAPSPRGVDASRTGSHWSTGHNVEVYRRQLVAKVRQLRHTLRPTGEWR